MDQTQTFTSVSTLFTETIGSESENSYFASLLFTNYFSQSDFELEQAGALFTAIENENTGIFRIDYLSSLGQGQLTISGEEQDNSISFDADFNFVGIDSSTIDGNLTISGEEQDNSVFFDANYELNENGSLSETGSLGLIAEERSNGEIFFDLNIEGSDQEGQERTEITFLGTVDDDNNVLNGSITTEFIENGVLQDSQTTIASFPVPDGLFIDNQEEIVEPIDPPGNPGVDPLTGFDTQYYRFQNTEVPGTYLFVDQRERQNILDNFPVFREEGAAFKVRLEPGDDDDNLVEVNRYRSNKTQGTYLFATADNFQTDSSIIQSDFTLEGRAFYAYGAGSGNGVDYYRFENTERAGTYLFPEGVERDNILNNFPSFEDQGAVWAVER